MSSTLHSNIYDPTGLVNQHVDPKHLKYVFKPDYYKNIKINTSCSGWGDGKNGSAEKFFYGKLNLFS